MTWGPNGRIPGPHKNGVSTGPKLSREERTQVVMQRMREGTFRRGITYAELMREWEMSEGGVSNITAEASRRVYAEMAETNGAKVYLGVTLEKIIDDSMADASSAERPYYYRKVAIEAAKTFAMLVGANAPTKVEHSVQEPDEVTDEACAKWLTSRGWQLAPPMQAELAQLAQLTEEDE
jgi:hypothetical protein